MLHISVKIKTTIGNATLEYHPQYMTSTPIEHQMVSNVFIQINTMIASDSFVL